MPNSWHWAHSLLTLSHLKKNTSCAALSYPQICVSFGCDRPSACTSELLEKIFILDWEEGGAETFPWCLRKPCDSPLQPRRFGFLFFFFFCSPTQTVILIGVCLYCNTIGQEEKPLTGERILVGTVCEARRSEMFCALLLRRNYESEMIHSWMTAVWHDVTGYVIYNDAINLLVTSRSFKKIKKKKIANNRKIENSQVVSNCWDSNAYADCSL